MPRRVLTNWDEIRDAYTLGIIENGQRRLLSLRELARRFSVSLRQVAEHSRREKWVELRKRNCNAIATRTTEKFVEAASDLLAEFNEDAFQLARIEIEAARRGVELHSKALAAIRQSKLAWPAKARLLKDLAVAFRSYAAGIESAIKSGRLTLGESQEITKEKYTFESWLRRTLEYFGEEFEPQGDQDAAALSRES